MATRLQAQQELHATRRVRSSYLILACPNACSSRSSIKHWPMGPSNMPYVKSRYSVPDCQPLQVLPGPSGQVAVAVIPVCICLCSEIAVCIFSMRGSRLACKLVRHKQCPQKCSVKAMIIFPAMCCSSYTAPLISTSLAFCVHVCCRYVVQHKIYPGTIVPMQNLWKCRLALYVTRPP